MRRPSIHWDSVKARLRASESALQEAISATPQRIEAASAFQRYPLWNIEEITWGYCLWEIKPCIEVRAKEADLRRSSRSQKL